MAENTGGAALALDTMAAPAPNAGGGLTVSGGGYRPTGRDTIYGRAYDKAGTAIYWSQLETEMRSTAQQAYMLHGDDPAKLEEVFTELAREQMREHVFPEIAADYAVGFQRLTEGYMLDARKKQIARQKEADRAGFIERTNELLTTQEQQLAAMEPGSAHAAEAIAGSQAAIDAHYDDAVRRGIMSADDAAGAKITASRNAALRFYERQAEGKTPAEIRDLKTAMQADFADGGIEGLDGPAGRRYPAGSTRWSAARQARKGRPARRWHNAAMTWPRGSCRASMSTRRPSASSCSMQTPRPADRPSHRKPWRKSRLRAPCAT
jgi:hypothetical protein